MEALKNIRLVFGIQQEAMAQLLGISLSHLKMAETGKRMLPASALPVFFWLESEANRLSSTASANEEAELLDFAIELLILKKSKRQLEKKITKIQLQGKQNQRLVQLGPGFRAQFPFAQFPSPSMRMDALVYNAGIEIQYSDVKSSILLQMELEGIQAKIRFLESK